MSNHPRGRCCNATGWAAGRGRVREYHAGALVSREPWARAPRCSTRATLYVASTTDTVVVLTARGNTFAETYPMTVSNGANNAITSESLTVNLNQFRWHALNAEPTSIVQKGYTSNCNSNQCSLAYGSSVTAADTLLYGARMVWPEPAFDAHGHARGRLHARSVELGRQDLSPRDSPESLHLELQLCLLRAGLFLVGHLGQHPGLRPGMGEPEPAVRPHRHAG